MLEILIGATAIPLGVMLIVFLLGKWQERAMRRHPLWREPGLMDWRRE
jgi:hypothetical protein